MLKRIFPSQDFAAKFCKIVRIHASNPFLVENHLQPELSLAVVEATTVIDPWSGTSGKSIATSSGLLRRHMYCSRDGAETNTYALEDDKTADGEHILSKPWGQFV
jgi:hypothetical protein